MVSLGLSSTLTSFTQLPDSFAEAVQACDVSPTPALLAHCRRELFHAVWRLLLDQEFCQAYEHGITVTCADRVIRRVFPRIFTYSADYPEKYVARSSSYDLALKI
jgi:hypothetical protein